MVKCNLSVGKSSGSYGMAPLQSRLSETSRFLTLAVATDGGDGISEDWTMFGDPRLELTPAKKPVVRIRESCSRLPNHHGRLHFT
jgi:hypothetical protein